MYKPAQKRNLTVKRASQDYGEEIIDDSENEDISFHDSSNEVFSSQVEIVTQILQN